MLLLALGFKGGDRPDWLHEWAGRGATSIRYRVSLASEFKFKVGEIMAGKGSFENHTVICCGTLRPELDHLEGSGFLDAKKILYTAPGLHEDYRKLKAQLSDKLEQAMEYSENIIVVYGSNCYLDLTTAPPEHIDDLLNRSGGSIARIRATRCVDMLVDADGREDIAKEEKVYWITPGWLKYWRGIFASWDAAKANETFPRYDKAIILDALGLYEKYSLERPEEILEFADWMGIPIEPYGIALDRLMGLLSDGIGAGELGRGDPRSHGAQGVS